MAEAPGSGSESGHVPEMLDKPDEAVQRLTGNKEPLSDAIAEGGTGYFSGHNLQAAKGRGIETLIPDQQFRKRDAQFAGRKQPGGKGRFTAEDFVYNLNNSISVQNSQNSIFREDFTVVFPTLYRKMSFTK